MPDIDLSADERVRLDELHALAMTATFYELLGVPTDADSKAVQRAYYELSRTWHPDRFFRRDLGPYTERLEFVFTTMTRAYRTLSDNTARSRYHREMAERGAELGPLKEAAPPPAQQPEQPHGYEVTLERRAAGATTGPTAARGPTSATPNRPTAPPRRAMESRVVTQIREQLRERNERGQRYYETGLADLAAGRASKAASSFHLALQFDPNNAEYKQKLDEAQGKSRTSQLDTLLAQSKAAEDQYNPGLAMALLEKTLEYDPPDAAIWFRVAVHTRDKLHDPRKAVNYLRKAVEKAPDNLEYRLALADVYMELKLQLNAKREYQAVLDRDKKNERARKVLKAMGVLML